MTDIKKNPEQENSYIKCPLCGAIDEVVKVDLFPEDGYPLGSFALQCANCSAEINPKEHTHYWKEEKGDPK